MTHSFPTPRSSAPGQRLRGLRGIDAAGRACVEHDAVEALHPFGDQCAAFGVPAGFVAVAEAFGERAAQEAFVDRRRAQQQRSEEHTSELQSLMRISYAVFCLQKKKNTTQAK